MASEQERVSKAYKAMKSLGISVETVKPALRRLWKLYNKNWELIEEDNYRTLADAIFEYEDDKLKAEKKPDSEDNRPQSKKPYRGDPEDEISSTGGNSKNILDLDGREIPRSSSSSKYMDLVPLHSCPDEENSYAPSASHAKATLKKCDGSTQFAIPALQLHPGSSNVTSPHSERRRKQNGSTSAHNPQTTFQTTYDIASSACGQVRISLTCKHTASNHSFLLINYIV